MIQHQEAEESRQSAIPDIHYEPMEKSHVHKSFLAFFRNVANHHNERIVTGLSGPRDIYVHVREQYELKALDMEQDYMHIEPAPVVLQRLRLLTPLPQKWIHRTHPVQGLNQPVLVQTRIDMAINKTLYRTQLARRRIVQMLLYSPSRVVDESLTFVSSTPDLFSKDDSWECIDPISSMHFIPERYDQPDPFAILRIENALLIPGEFSSRKLSPRSDPYQWV